jgi:hypothetical protein
MFVFQMYWKNVQIIDACHKCCIFGIDIDLVGQCGVGNQPSRNIPHRLEFHFEGIERAGELYPDGKFIDIKVYSKLRDEVEKQTEYINVME